MDQTVLFAKTQQEARWNSPPNNSFNIDENLSITFSIFRTTRDANKNKNHIASIAFNIHGSFPNDQILIENNDVLCLNNKIEYVLEKTNIKGYRKAVYSYAIQAIILKVLLFDFANQSNDIVFINVQDIKSEFEKLINYSGIEELTKEQFEKITSKSNIEKFCSIDLKNTIDCTYFTKTINDFETMMNNSNLGEEDWQEFFTKNFRILSSLFIVPVILRKDKAYVGGKTIDNSNGQLADYLFKNQITENSFLIEIKTPEKKLFKTSVYREQIYDMSEDLIGGVNQLMKYINTFNKEFYETTKHDQTISCWNVKAMLIIGKSSNLTLEKKAEFELLRNSLNNIQIITFDELLLKLKSILDIVKN